MTLPSYTLCADDFALSPQISETIADLARRGCINAISCMAVFPGWRRDARLLTPLGGAGTGDAGGGGGGGGDPANVQVGLHLVLAGERPITRMARQGADGRLPSADATMLLAHARRLDLDELSAEVDAQFAAFATAMGRAPDFVDAHQHMHVFPGVRERVIAATLRHAPGAWMRNPADRLAAALRRPFAGKAIGSNLHAIGLARAFARHGIASNDSFAGHYDYRGDYEALLPAFFRAAGRRHLIMCHPGDGRLADDSIADARIVEAAVLGAMPLAERIAALTLTPGRTPGLKPGRTPDAHRARHPAPRHAPTPPAP
ncbi:ChbG/HpnK family deacetylase [Sphingobium sufflavum]|uniref:ChbG/HpnK family deacetylase n=1 Tax=Sphingobium sufflavum TaxID=1129547 RepID=UPI001F3C371E|nr:ChbG/HpnK family deacetylase [Sphingobium sufflavum]MCE7796371.1 ChbG/HpnK family deacetylase [Sphingobium sufflavum]